MHTRAQLCLVSGRALLPSHPQRLLKLCSKILATGVRQQAEKVGMQ